MTTAAVAPALVHMAQARCEIAAQALVVTSDGGRIEGQSPGLRHGPPDGMAALARGEIVAADH